MYRRYANGKAVALPPFFVLAGFLLASPILAVNPMPAYSTYPCTPPTTNCQGGTIDTDLQEKVTPRSTRSSCQYTDTYGNCYGNFQGGSCPYSSQWCTTPKILSYKHTVLNKLTGLIQFDIEYDFPNNYCQTWDPPATWPIPWPSHNAQLQIFNGGNELVHSVGIFEHGRWKPTVTVSCPAELSIVVTSFCGSPTQASVGYPLVGTDCRSPDHASCPLGGGGGGDRGPFGDPTGALVKPPTVGQSINVGSGDVATAIPLFSIGQSPLSLVFNLTYHSSPLSYSSVTVPEPVGKGWTHAFNQILKPIPSTSPQRLYHYTADGREHEYTQSGSVWTASRPGELRGTVTLVSGEYRLTDLDGTVTAFDQATGRWKRTTDRWGNSIQGAPVGSNPTTITDSMGRQIQLAYTSGQVTITLPDGNAWKLILGTNNTLTQIFDPMHTGATPWRTFSYQNDHLGVLRLLTSMKDDANQELEAHTYEAATDRGLTSSQAGGTKSNVSIVYDDSSNPPTRTVTTTIDATTSETTTYTLAYLSGRWLPTQISGPCASCGGTDADQQIFTYDSSNHVTDKLEGSGAEQGETQYTYDGNGMMLTRKEAVAKPEQRTTTYSYNYASGTPSGGAPWPSFVTSVTESSVAKAGQSKVMSYAWNATGTPETTLTSTISGYLKSTDTSPTVYTTTTLFEVKHRPVEVDGPVTGQKSTLTYYADTDATLDRRGRLQQTSVYTSATAHLDTQFDNYDIFGTAKKVIDPNGVETDRVTDSVGRVTSITSLHVTGDPNEAADYTTTYTYDTRDWLTKVTLPVGNQLQYAYEDGTNRLTDTIRADASGNQRERLHLTLNVIGGKSVEQAQSCNVPAASCAAWTTQRSDTFSYDTHNRLSSVTHPDATHLNYSYDSRGNLLTVQDERHTAPNTLYAYDFLNRLKTVTQKQTLTPGPDVVTQYSYDVQDNLRSVTDPNGNVTTYAYDDFRRMQTQTSPVAGITSYTYDPAGNLLTSTDANTAATTRVYDVANRITSATSTRAGLATETVTWTYDDPTAGNYGKGRVATMTDPTGSTTYAYERRGLTRSEAKTVLGNAYSRAYGYDANGNRSRMTYPSGRVVTYTFDFADRPFSAVSGGTTYVSSASYAPFGPQTQLQYGNATSKTSTYDQRYRPAENKLTAGASTLADYVYQEDAAGNVTQIHDAMNAAYNRDFGYDDLSRLTTSNSGSSLWGTATGNGYTYDSMGNVLSLTLGTARTATFSYSGTTPKLSSVTETGPGTRLVSYDAAGNESAVGAGTFTYSARNFLAAADGNTYTYDGRGLRTIILAPLAGGVSLSSVTLNPISVVGGSTSTGTATLDGPAPTGGATVTLTSSNTSVATVPASVTIVAGATSNTFTVTTSAVPTSTPVIISGTYGVTQTATLTVTPPSVASVTLNPTSVVGGRPSTGTVTLTGPAPTGGAVVTLTSSNTSVATVPASVTVASGTTSKTFTVTTLVVSSTATVTITGSYGGTSQNATLTVTPAAVLYTLTLSPTSVVGGNSSTGTVTLNGPAPTGGAVVTLSSSNTAVATVPASATVAAGATTKTFTVTTLGVTASTPVTISGTYGGTKSATLTVTPANLVSVTLNKTSVLGGTSSTGTVTLDGKAPSAGDVVTLSSSNTSVATVPASVTVTSGTTSKTFTVTTFTVASTTTVTITASLNGVNKTAILTVTPTSVLYSITLNPTTVAGATPSTGTATLNGPAPTGGALVTLASSNTSVATVPASVTVAAGASTATFTVTSLGAASSTAVTISGTYGGTQSAILTVIPLALSSLTLSQTSAYGSFPVTGTVTLNGKALSGGLVVALASSNTAVATVPASVTVPADSTTGTFTVTTFTVTSTTNVTLTASYSGVNKTAVLTVTPTVLLYSLALSPTSVVGGNPSIGLATLNGPAPSGGVVVTLSSSNTAVATVPASTTVPAGATKKAFTVTTLGVAASSSAVITASYAGVNKTATQTVTAAALTSLTLNPTSVVGGTSTIGTVTLTGAAPVAGTVVTLSSSNPSVATVPSSVTVGSGASTASFTVTTTTVASVTSVTLTASFAGVNKTAVLSVTPTAAVYTLVLSQTSALGGIPVTGTVTLDGPAPTGGATVTLTSSNTTAATVPPNVSIAAGTTSNSFIITTLAVTSTKTSNITASYGGVSKSVTLTVTPTAVLYALALSPTSVVGGNTSTGTATLNGPAPTGGATVTLSSSNTAVATVPANVIVAAGTASNTFTVTTVPVFASTSATITATYSGSKTAVLTVTPNVAFLFRSVEIFLAEASEEPDQTGTNGKDEAETSEKAPPIALSPSAVTAVKQVPAFKLASLGNLGTNPFADLFRLRLGPDVESSGVSDSSEGGDGLLAGRFWNLGFGSAMAARASSGVRAPLVSTGSRYFFYTPEMNLMAETELTSNPTPLVLYEYIWFGGQPVAQVDSAGVTSWTFTDHLGTPLIQTSSAQGVTWRAEHEPYGQVFALRTADQHQPLRLPGQEAEQLNLGPNGATERSYNIFRWYRGGWGGYTQTDPLLTPTESSSTYLYAAANPLVVTDPTGEALRYGHYCGPGQDKGRPKPIDAIDEACQKHDDCYNAAHLSFKDVFLPPNPRKPNDYARFCAQFGCDSALCRFAAAFEQTAKTQKEKTVLQMIKDYFCHGSICPACPAPNPDPAPSLPPLPSSM